MLYGFGWIFIYIVAFGVNDFLVKKYVKTDLLYIIYYFFLGCIGLYILNKFGHLKG